MQCGVDRRITRFVEKPKDEAVLHEMKISRELLAAIGSGESEELFQASMGIYVFNRDVLVQCLNNDLADFGKHIIPQSIKDRHVSAFIFKGYWEDIGTIRAFYEANLDLTELVPEYSFFDTEAPIYTQDRKSTRLNSSHEWISYAVFCLKKKKKSVKHTRFNVECNYNL